MGDRVSIQFARGEERSVVLFSHWDGISFVDAAREYVKELNAEVGDKEVMPIDRGEPGTVMVDFVRWYLVREGMEKKRVDSNYYFGATPEDGDNSDNGNHVIDLEKKPPQIARR